MLCLKDVKSFYLFLSYRTFSIKRSNSCRPFHVHHEPSAVFFIFHSPSCNPFFVIASYLMSNPLRVFTRRTWICSFSHSPHPYSLYCQTNTLISINHSPHSTLSCFSYFILYLSEFSFQFSKNPSWLLFDCYRSMCQNLKKDGLHQSFRLLPCCIYFFPLITPLTFSDLPTFQNLL